VRHLDKERFARRFPLISDLCESFDIDVSRDLIPVRPSAHYMIGGVKTDLSGRTSVENLFACGEAASTALHGANRLGSNSLLEGLVFGRIAGQAIAQGQPPMSHCSRIPSSDIRFPIRIAADWIPSMYATPCEL